MKWRQDHEQMYFFISNHIQVNAVWGKARRSTLAGRLKDSPSARLHSRAVSQGPQRDTAGPQGGCRNLVCCSRKLIPPAFPADSQGSGPNLLLPSLHDQIIHRLFQVLCGVSLCPPSASLQVQIHVSWQNSVQTTSTFVCSVLAMSDQIQEHLQTLS